AKRLISDKSFWVDFSSLPPPPLPLPIIPPLPHPPSLHIQNSFHQSSLYLRLHFPPPISFLSFRLRSILKNQPSFPPSFLKFFSTIPSLTKIKLFFLFYHNLFLLC